MVARACRGTETDKQLYVYILQCVDNTYYVGWTKDLLSRVKTHNEGQGAKYTFSRRPVKLVYSEEHECKSEALRRECQLKKWSRAQKEALIKGDLSQRQS